MNELDEICKKYGFTDEFIEQVVRNTIITGTTIIFVDENNKFKIINPFKGCECGETHES